jgi:hypothetical protein
VPDLVGLIRPLNAGKRPVEARHEFLTHRGVAVEGGRGCHRLNLAAMRAKRAGGFGSGPLLLGPAGMQIRTPSRIKKGRASSPVSKWSACARTESIRSYQLCSNPPQLRYLSLETGGKFVRVHRAPMLPARSARPCALKV